VTDAPAGQVESSEFVPAARRQFDPAVLARVEGLLAESIGPLARVLVRKAAETAPDATALCQVLTMAVPEPQQSAFRQRLGHLVGAPPPVPASSPAGSTAASPPAPPRGLPERPMSAEILAEATERLAVHIGPVARLLVKRAAQQASGTRDLYERLARHIDDPEERQRFAAATEELSEP
jgi:serine/threonine-protein kinase